MNREKRSVAFYALLIAGLLAGAGVILLVALLLALLPVPFSRATEPRAAETTDTGLVATDTELVATLEGPASLPDGKAVQVRFTVTNRSDTGLYLLKWYTPLEGIWGEIFRVTRDGQAIPYEGPLVMRGDPLPENYVLLEPGASASADVDLATVYDFSQAGEYTIAFLSPRISYVARTRADLAQTVDDLGPVEIPSNRVTIRIGTP
jgi:hypothetical protein